MFQAIQPDFIHGFKPNAQFSFRKPLSLEPNKVVFGDITNQPVLVFTEGHFFRDQVE